MWNRDAGYGQGAGHPGALGPGGSARLEDARALPCQDPEALGRLLHALEPRLTAVAMRFTRDPETARDVVQNAFEKVVKHCDRFRGGSKASTWMHRIVANEALMWLRSERRRAERSVAVDDWNETPLPEETPSVTEELDQARLVQRVREGLEALRPEEREVLQRCTIEGRTYVQFGAEIGLEPAAVKSRAFRARRRLGEILARE